MVVLLVAGLSLMRKDDSPAAAAPASASGAEASAEAVSKAADASAPAAPAPAPVASAAPHAAMDSRPSAKEWIGAWRASQKGAHAPAAAAVAPAQPARAPAAAPAAASGVALPSARELLQQAAGDPSRLRGHAAVAPMAVTGDAVLYSFSEDEEDAPAPAQPAPAAAAAPKAATAAVEAAAKPATAHAAFTVRAQPNMGPASAPAKPALPAAQPAAVAAAPAAADARPSAKQWIGASKASQPAPPAAAAHAAAAHAAPAQPATAPAAPAPKPLALPAGPLPSARELLQQAGGDPARLRGHAAVTPAAATADAVLYVFPDAPVSKPKARTAAAAPRAAPASAASAFSLQVCMGGRGPTRGMLAAAVGPAPSYARLSTHVERFGIRCSALQVGKALDASAAPAGHNVRGNNGAAATAVSYSPAAAPASSLVVARAAGGAARPAAGLAKPTQRRAAPSGPVSVKPRVQTSATASLAMAGPLYAPAPPPPRPALALPSLPKLPARDPVILGAALAVKAGEDLKGFGAFAQAGFGALVALAQEGARRARQ